jgi:hypothetical protein
MLKGFTHARLACGCRISFRDGVEGSPVTVVIDEKGATCALSLHVRDLPLFVVRAALNRLEHVTIDPEQERLPLSHCRY